MFEESLMESGHRIRTKSKYWSVASFLFNSGLILVLILWPLLHPAALPKQMMSALLVAPAPPVALPSATVAVTHSRPETVRENLFAAPSRIPNSIRTDQEPETPSSLQGSIQGIDSNSAAALDSVIGSVGTSPAITVRTSPPPPKKLVISSGLMDGNLIDKTLPQYPAIARAARIQGTVVLQATISKAGLIENLRMISGPAMLQQAAIDAVRSWRYRPYLLNGEPVEVETSVNVVFRLGD